MKRTIISAITLGTIVIAGCTPRYTWTKPSTSQATFNSDFNQCQYEANRYSYSAYQTGSSTAAAIVSGMDQGIQQNKLMEMCMKAKGYELVETAALEKQLKEQKSKPHNYVEM